ncbi:MAG: N-acetylmuramoyl-L-alanine amidase [Actinomycetota bacterium]
MLGEPVSESEGREPDGHDDCPACRAQPEHQNTGVTINRRGALRLAGGASVALAITPVLRTSGARPVDIAGARPVLSPRPDWPAPAIVTRGEWGANEAIREGGQEFDGGVEKLVIHHTVTPNNPGDPAGVLRSIYEHAVAGEYIDLQYNWMIDHNGRLYEGRWATDYPSGVAHTGERNGANVRGGHALAHNSRTIGVAFMGTYTDVAPPGPAIESLITFLTWKCARWGIDPLGATPYVNGDGNTVVIPNICGHRDTKATTCPGAPLWSMLPDIRNRVADRLRDGSTGYWIASREGRLFAFGNLPDQGDTRRLGLPVQLSGVTAHPSGLGYWLFARDGGVFTFGAAHFHGSTGGMRLNAPMIGMAAAPTGSGYWLVARDGGVFSFGDARFFGSTGGLRLNAPVLGMCPTPTGGGYWLYALDGGIFSYGDARFFGSTGGIRLNRPIVAMAARPQADGYWLVAEDGGVFAFGNAGFYGSGADYTLRGPVVGMIPTTTGAGYALLVRDGGLLSFGDAPFLGSAAGRTFEAVGLAGKLVPR